MRLLIHIANKKLFFKNTISRSCSTQTFDPQTQLISKYHRRKGHKKKKHFVDVKRVTVEAGSGGSGCVSFLSLFAKEFAGPDGGDGGHGGHVIFQANTGMRNLNHVKSLINAPDGEKGRNDNCFGKNSEHLFLKVPVGSLIRDKEGAVLADLCNHGDHFVGVHGGAGGKGNKFFASPINVMPTCYEEGGRGESKVIIIEMQTIADIGLVGFPNAGKSTLLRALTDARPAVAPYAFTTLRPQLGAINHNYNQIIVADLPGLIPGAHLNRGLGLSFLRHVERCLCLLFVLDMSAPDPLAQLSTLHYEIERYKPGLAQQTQYAILANKTDLPHTTEKLQILQDSLKSDIKLFPISAKMKTNLDSIHKYIKWMYDSHNKIT